MYCGRIITFVGVFFILSIQIQIVSSTNLTCYDCSDSFKNFWNPYTPCQKNLSAVPLRQCHEKDQYCKVERRSLKSITLSISRGCTLECLYGCKVYGYGITELRCTSCCRGYACNTDNSSKNTSQSYITLFISTLILLLTCSSLIENHIDILTL